MSNLTRVVLICRTASLFRQGSDVLGFPERRSNHTWYHSGQLCLHLLYQPDASEGLEEQLTADGLASTKTELLIYEYQRPLLSSDLPSEYRGRNMVVISPPLQAKEGGDCHLPRAVTCLRKEVGGEYAWLEDPSTGDQSYIYSGTPLEHGQPLVSYEEFSDSQEIDQVFGSSPVPQDGRRGALALATIRLVVPQTDAWQTAAIRYTQELIVSISNNISKTIDNIRSTEQIYPPLQITLPLSVDPVHLPSFGSTVIVMIPTANRAKKRCLEKAISRASPAGNPLRFVIVAADSEVGEQPYNEAGLAGARNRIHNTLALLKTAEYEERLRQWAASTVIVACIESFIQLDGVDRPTDYGLLVFHNATTGQSAIAVSKGVSVPLPYLERARRFGFKAGSPNYGRVTVGSVLAANVPGLDQADWHRVLCGYSRYDLLDEAAGSLAIPW